MVRYLGAVIVAVLVMVALALVWRRMSDNAPSSGLSLAEQGRQRQLLDDAARLMSGMGVGMDPDDLDILTPRTGTAIGDWIRRYERHRRDIDRA